MELEPANTIRAFTFDNQSLGVIEHDGEYWFTAQEACQMLALANRSHALSRLDDDEKGSITINDKPTLIVSESGLYSLALTSRKEEAKTFKRWITHEVLPALRKTGRYEIQPQPNLSPLDALEQMLTAMRTQERRLELLEGGQVELEHRFADQPISAHADKRSHIQRLIQELGNVKGGRVHIGLAYRRFKAHYGLPGAFDALKVTDYADAVRLLRRWIDEARDDLPTLYN